MAGEIWIENQESKSETFSPILWSLWIWEFCRSFRCLWRMLIAVVVILVEAGQLFHWISKELNKIHTRDFQSSCRSIFERVNLCAFLLSTRMRHWVCSAFYRVASKSLFGSSFRFKLQFGHRDCDGPKSSPVVVLSRARRTILSACGISGVPVLTRVSSFTFGESKSGFH